MSRFRFRTKNSGLRPLNSLDFKLVKQAQRRSLPRPSQLKYLFHFLSGGEKLTFNLFFAGAIIGLFVLLGTFLTSHLAFVPKEGGEYSEALIGQPKYINPLYAPASDVDQDLSALVYAGLFRYNKDQVLIPEIAENYTVSADGKTYDVALRHNVKFADGETLTASDVIYTFDLIQNPEVASPLFSAFQGVKIEKVNDYLVRFTLKAPFAPFLSSLTVGILPEHIWGETSPASLRLAKNNLQPLGAGAWQFNKLVKDATGRIDSFTLSRNDNYFGAKPYFKTLRFKFFDEYGSAVEALRSQAVDALSFLPESSGLQTSNKSIAFFSLQLPEYSALFFNQSAAPALKDSDLRLALAKATDKNAIISEVLDDQGKIIDSPILPGSLGYNENGKHIAFNIDEANQLLDKKWTRLEPEEYFDLRRTQLLKELQSASSTASSTAANDVSDEQITSAIRQEMDPAQSFYRRDKDNKILELTITTADTEEYGRTAIALAKMWEKIGIKTTIEKVGASRLVRQEVKNRDYQILLYSEIVGSDPDPYPFWHSSQIDYPGLNLAGFSDRAADKLLEDARATVSPAARADLYSKLQDIMVNEIPAIFLYTPLHTMAINKEIQGVDLMAINAPADRYADLASWYVKTKLKWK